MTITLNHYPWFLCLESVSKSGSKFCLGFLFFRVKYVGLVFCVNFLVSGVLFVSMFSRADVDSSKATSSNHSCVG